MIIKCVTYLIYIIFWEGLIFGGTGYAVFHLGHSGWWMLAAVIIGGCAYSPLKWIHGQDKGFINHDN
jgi:hypothetical protein